jgi:large subunit ribosomal protein L10
MLVIQHNNLKASEWAGIRRELALALKKAAPKPTEESLITPAPLDPSETIRIQIIQTGIFAAALRVTEFFRPQQPLSLDGSVHPSEQAAEEAALSHALSEAAYAATRPTKAQLKRRGIKGGKAKHVKKMTPLHRLLKGPIALLTFPNVAPEQLATALKIIAPTTGSTSAFPAPRRRDAPGYYEPAVQAGLQKLLLLGARVDGKVVDQEGVKRVGGLPGLEGLRGQLVSLLSSAGMGLTRALESAGNSVWFNLESRRLDMEEQAKPKEEAKEEVKIDAPAA